MTSLLAYAPKGGGDRESRRALSTRPFPFPLPIPLSNSRQAGSSVKSICDTHVTYCWDKVNPTPERLVLHLTKNAANFKLWYKELRCPFDACNRYFCPKLEHEALLCSSRIHNVKHNGSQHKHSPREKTST